MRLELRFALLAVFLALLQIASPTPGAAAPAAQALLDGQFASAIVIDADTGEVLLEKNAHARRQPASMLKMLTELLVLERIHEGDISLQDEVRVSAKASRMGGSQVYLKHGEVFTVEELLMALSIQSANDAAVALAEHVAGTVAAFVDLMNLRARELGMQDSEFHSVHGLPPGRGQKPDLTSAYDMALLGRQLIKYPEALHWSSTAKATFRDGQFGLWNPNHLIGTFRGLDGLKTGFHGQAGFCVTATAVQKGKRLISVLMGAPTDGARKTETSRLLSYAFNLYTQVTLVEEGRTPLEEHLPVAGGKSSDLAAAYVGPLEISVRKDRVAEVILRAEPLEDLSAPVEEGQVVGRGVAMLDGRELGSVSIVSLESVPKGSWLDRLFH